MVGNILDDKLYSFLESEINRSNLVKRPLDQKSLSYLRYLNMGSWDIETLNGIEWCVELKSLHMGNTKVKDLSPLLELKDLSILDISMNPQIDWTNITKPFTTVKELSLRACELKNDKVLSLFPNVVSVFLFDNKISKIESIHSLEKLEAIDLRYNPISRSELESFYNVTGIGSMNKNFPVIQQ